MGKVIGAVIAMIIIILMGMSLFGEGFLYIGIPSVVVGFVVAVGIILYEEIRDLKTQIEALSQSMVCKEKSNQETLAKND